QVAQPLYLAMAAFVVLAAGCLLGEEFGIQRIKYGHAFMGLLLIAAVVIILLSLNPSLLAEGISWKSPADGIWEGPSLVGFAVPLLVGLLVGPWLDLQHWQRAIQMHREKTSIRASYIIGGLIFFVLLLFHGSLAAWVMSRGDVLQ
ncbi:MAG: hypothetical protein R3242_10810, partial [Akkermansiaceae bacterium]|nr:hypothetical protein [Akkermansiaceae bacterium]